MTRDEINERQRALCLELSDAIKTCPQYLPMLIGAIFRLLMLRKVVDEQYVEYVVKEMTEGANQEAPL